MIVDRAMRNGTGAFSRKAKVFPRKHPEEGSAKEAA